MSKIRVFLVEDNETISANLIAIIHELTNVEVIGVARTEEQAVGWMSKNTADVYIIDVMLKSGDGLSILKQININKGIWIIFSNYTVPNLVKTSVLIMC